MSRKDVFLYEDHSYSISSVERSVIEDIYRELIDIKIYDKSRTIERDTVNVYIHLEKYDTDTIQSFLEYNYKKLLREEMIMEHKKSNFTKLRRTKIYNVTIRTDDDCYEEKERDIIFSILNKYRIRRIKYNKYDNEYIDVLDYVYNTGRDYIWINICEKLNYRDDVIITLCDYYLEYEICDGDLMRHD